MRKLLTLLLVALFIAACVFTAWQWHRPYDPAADKNVPFRIEEVNVQRDQSYSWINLTMSDASAAAANVPPIVTLIADAMAPLEAADYRYFPKTQTFHLRFWIENRHLEKALQLQFDQGTLLLKNASIVNMQDQETRIFSQPQW